MKVAADESQVGAQLYNSNVADSAIGRSLERYGEMLVRGTGMEQVKDHLPVTSRG